MTKGAIKIRNEAEQTGCWGSSRGLGTRSTSSEPETYKPTSLQPARSARVTPRWQARTPSEARLRSAAVRYASVGTRFPGPCSPQTEALTATDDGGGSG
jgi:hypothetical protein